MRDPTRPRDPFARANRGGRNRARTVTSILAVATILAMPTRETIAQNMTGAFDAMPSGTDMSNGAGTFYQGTNFTISRGDNVDTVTITAPTAVIDWTATANAQAGTGTIDIMPSGTVATFQEQFGNQGGFTVLNRLLPTGANTSRPVSLNGLIQSRVRDANGAFIPGGNVWFYSPGGILVGSGATIDVGGLFLTTADVPNINADLDTDGFVAGAHTGISTATAKIEIRSTNITADNYVAVLAPQIEQAGSVNARGAVAYVAAVQANIAGDGGLFDISVPLGGGTSVANAITHSGSTTVQVDVAGEPSHGIYAVAIPKNTAITMLLGGNIGFSVASGAESTPRGIVLSAGRDVAGTAIGDLGDPSAGAGTGSVTIRGGGANLNGPIYVQSKNALTLSGGTYGGDTLIRSPGAAVTIDTSTASTTFQNGLVVDASQSLATAASQGGAITLSASGGRSLSFAGNVNLEAEGYGTGNFNGTGGTINVSANGGDISFGSALVADAGGNVGRTPTSGNGGIGQGGTITIAATNSGGAISIAAGLNLTAFGTGGDSSDALGGAGRGGTVSVQANSGGTVDIIGSPGTVNLVASAEGGFGATGGGATTAVGRAELRAAGGTITIGNANTPTGVSLFAHANGGDTTQTGTVGTARAGTTGIYTSGAGTVTVYGLAVAAAPANAGQETSSAGDAFGGKFELLNDGSGAVNLHGGLSVLLDAFGGYNGDGGNGGAGTAGTATIRADGTTTTTIDGLLSLTAEGRGGGAGDGGTGGLGRGGTIILGGGTGTLGLPEVSIQAPGVGGVGANGEGSGVGGRFELLASGGDIEIDGNLTVPDLDPAGLTGSSTGGTFLFSASNATIDIAGDATIIASGSLPPSTPPQLTTANGGTITIGGDLLASVPEAGTVSFVGAANSISYATCTVNGNSCAPTSPPPPPPPPPPPVTEDPEVVAVVTKEIDRITTSVQSSLRTTRVAGGSVASGGALDAGGGAGGAGDNGVAGADNAASGDSGGDAAADAAGDDESADSGAPGSSGGGGNGLIDMSRVGAGGQQIDAPVTSGGNSSLWSGEDGLGETPGGNQ